MTKGKPWPVEDERKLREQLEKGLDIVGMAASFGDKYTKNAIYQKMSALGLKAKVTPVHETPSQAIGELHQPEELPSIEEKLKDLNAAEEAMKTPGLSRNEILRLQSIIKAVKIYNELFEKFVKYRDLEKEVLELRRKLASENENNNNTTR